VTMKRVEIVGKQMTESIRPKDIIPLSCSVQKYAWGKSGPSSAVARLVGASDADSYAELWMGTHPSGPSYVTTEGKRQLLSEHIGRELPYLFKVLSIAKALSVQAHPDKKLAAQLYRTRPDLYKDPNHKPEMAIATTDFQAMCGFRNHEEIASFLNSVPELRHLAGEAASRDFEDALLLSREKDGRVKPEFMKPHLQKLFASLMKAPKDRIEEQVNCLVSRLEAKISAADLERSAQAPREGRLIADEVALRLAKQFPGDVGVFAPYFLNLVFLKPGEGLCLEANNPHAYISGDCMECMACSDNVVRAGLTPKFIDADTLVSMLSYECGPAKLLFPQSISEHISVYIPPFEEFRLYKIDVPAGSRFSLPVLSSDGIVIVYEGEVVDSNHERTMKPGFVGFVPSRTEFLLKSTSSSLLFICSANEST